MAPATVTFHGDYGVVVYTALERPHPGEPGVVAGGLLGGDPELVERVRDILAGNGESRVCVVEPNLYYQFTDARDTLADVAAAMLAVGQGRGQISDQGLDALAAALGVEAAPPPADGHTVIY